MMRKGMLWIIVMAAFFVSVAWAQMGTVITRELLVRSGPSTRHKVIAKLKKGEQPLVEGLRGNWLKLAWKRVAWVKRTGISLRQGVAQPLPVDEQFVRWLIHDTKVNWAFVDRSGKNSVSLWVRMGSDRYKSAGEVGFIAKNLAESYRFHTGVTGPVEITILKPDARFIKDVYGQATLK